VNDSFSVTSNKWTTLLSIAAGQPSGPEVLSPTGNSTGPAVASDSVPFQGSVYNNVQIYQP
jgi:hypothetical protein